MPRPRSVAIPELFLGLLALAIAAVWIAHIFATTIHNAKHANDTVTITGSARKPIGSNLVQWALSVEGAAPTPTGAALRLARENDVVLAYLRRAGLSGAAILPQVVQTDVTVHRINKHTTVTTYHADQDFQVSTPLINVTQSAATHLGDLLERGITVSAQPLAFISTDLEQAKLDALGAATAEVHRRAEIIVKGLGGKLCPTRASTLGVYQITPRYSTDVSNYGIDDTSSRLKDVTAVVSATFAVER